MTINKLMDNMWEYNTDFVGDTFPMGMSCFYYDIWNDWKNDNQISDVDAISLWDNMMKTGYIYNDNEYDTDFICSLEYKEICEKIRLLKKDCDF